jgi:hypothetical protein
MLPVIFVFDMDETLIGESAPFLMQSKGLTKYIINACKSEKIDSCKGIVTTPCSIDKPKIDPEFFRPGLKDAFARLSKMFGGSAEFFIFSAGGKMYVKDVVSLIEAHADVSFNRPLFTTEDTIVNSSGETEKSIKMHADVFIKSLLPKYPALKKSENVDIVKKSRIMYLDDMNWTEEKSKDQFIQVTKFSYTPVYDLLWNVPDSIRVQAPVQEYLKRYNTHYNVFIEPIVPVSKTMRGLQYHTFMAEKHNAFVGRNELALKDTLFLELTKAIKPFCKAVHPFNPANMKTIRERLREAKVAV